MSTKWYGSLQNRLEENKDSTDVIEVGTGMTEYSWSDRTPYEVTAVENQKRVWVRRMDHRVAEGAEPMSNNWEITSNPENAEMLLTKRGSYWYWTNEFTEETLEMFEACEDAMEKYYLLMAGFEPEKVRKTGKQVKRNRANVSFGRAEYYYDYEF